MLFAAQFIMNAAWSFLFFEMQSPFAGLIGIVILWILIMATIIKVNEVNRSAALLLLPYILWVTFAGFLNFTIWQLNLY
jgi:tryptophan-rich sensory protein